MDGSTALLPSSTPIFPNPQLRVCVQNDDGNGARHALDMPVLRHPNGTEKPERLTVQDGWLEAELKVCGAQAWIIVSGLGVGLMVGGWRVQACDKDRVYVEVFEDGDWREVTEQEFRNWEKLHA